MDIFKKYFNTPKVPITFYYTPYIYVFLTKFIYMAFDGSYSIMSWIYNIILFLLGSYTFAWMSDYVLEFKSNVFLRYFFMRSVIFRRDFGTLARMSYDYNRRTMTTNKLDVKGNKWTWREAHETYIKRVFLGFIINIIAKYILAWMFLFVFTISIFLHPIVIKKYYNRVKELEDIEPWEEI